MKLLIILLFFIKLNGYPIEYNVTLIGDQATNTTVKSDLSKYNYSIIPNDQDNEIIDRNEEIVFKSYDETGGYEVNLDDTVSVTTTTPETTTIIEISNSTITENPENDEINPVFEINSNDTENRPIRQDNDDDDANRANDVNEFAEDENDDEDEEDTNMITGLISAFLGGLSRPDGSIDVEAITGLLGSLSMQNDDGTYDFNGLTDLLRSFFGGGGEDGGGSDFGAFIGGLLGALLKGITNPPGAKGAGILTGKIVTGLLPALSGPPPSDDTNEGGNANQPQQLDSGSFLGGLLKTILGGSSGGSSANTTNDNNQGGGSKFPIFKAIFSLITSVFTSSSSKSH